MHGLRSYSNLGFNRNQSVDLLLKKPETKLEDLLDEDGIINDMKQLTEPLMEFMFKRENFSKLIDFAITEPDLETCDFDQKRIYKYPYVAAEILGNENPKICDQFFQYFNQQDPLDSDRVLSKSSGSFEEDVLPDITKMQSHALREAQFIYLDQLFSFLDSEEELNYTLAGYFSRILNSLINKKSSSLLIYMYKKKPEYLTKLADKLISNSITETLIKLINFEESVVIGIDEEILDVKRGALIQKIMKKLEGENDLEEITNATRIICDTVKNYQTTYHANEVLKLMVQKRGIEQFLNFVLSQNSDSQFAGSTVLISILNYYLDLEKKAKEQQDRPNSAGSPSNSRASSNNDDDLIIMQILLENLEKIVKIITSDSNESVQNQAKQNVSLFGKARLSILQLLVQLFQLNSNQLAEKIIELDLVGTIWKIFKDRPLNNMIHDLMEKCLNTIIYGSNEKLKLYLFENKKISELVINEIRSPDINLGGKHNRVTRKGYMGHLIRIANNINDYRHFGSTYFKEGQETWDQFLKKELKQTNDTNNFVLGGRDPRVPPEESTPKQDKNAVTMDNFSNLFKITQNESKTPDSKSSEKSSEKNSADTPSFGASKNKMKSGKDLTKARQSKPAQNSENGSTNIKNGDQAKESSQNNSEEKLPESIDQEIQDGLIPPSSENAKDKDQFGFLHRIELKDNLEDYQEEDGEDLLWFSEPSTPESVSMESVDEEVKMNAADQANELSVKEDQKVGQDESDDKFLNNTYWANDINTHNIDDILKEFEGM